MRHSYNLRRIRCLERGQTRDRPKGDNDTVALWLTIRLWMHRVSATLGERIPNNSVQNDNGYPIKG